MLLSSVLLKIDPYAEWRTGVCLAEKKFLRREECTRSSRGLLDPFMFLFFRYAEGPDGNKASTSSFLFYSETNCYLNG